MEERNDKQIVISLHYYLEDEGVHQLNAFTHLYIEFELLHALLRLSELTKYFDVDIRVPKEGGFLEELIITNLNPDFIEFIKTVLVAYLSYYFTKKINTPENTRKRLEIAQKLKEEYENGKITQSEIDIYIQGDKKLKKIMEEYFKNIDTAKEIKGIEVVMSSQDEELCKTKIERSDFQTHYRHVEKDIIYDGETLVKNAILRIEIPILSSVSTRKWSGIYHGKKLSFNIKDTKFLDKVHQGNVTFGANTSIECDLEIGYIPSISHDGGLNKYPKPHYTVIKVHRVLQ